MLNRTVTVIEDQRFSSSTSNGVFDAIVASKGDTLQVKRHGIIHKDEYIELPKICTPNRILLDSAIRDGWVKVNN